MLAVENSFVVGDRRDRAGFTPCCDKTAICFFCEQEPHKELPKDRPRGRNLEDFTWQPDGPTKGE